MSTAFKSADILLPKNADMSKWAVVACDQYTSEPEYWADVEKITEGAKSALNLILPEVYLEDDNVDERIADIHKNMDSYISEGVFEEYKDAMIYVERTQSDGKVRAGIVGAIDLEEYDYRKGSKSAVRATEATVVERIPPRIKVRRGAPVELPHIMILVDDIEKSVVEFGSEDTKTTRGVKYQVTVPESKVDPEVLEPLVDQEVVLGVRPECIHDEPAFLAQATTGVINTTVEVTEMMGAETYLYLNCEGIQLTARVSPRSDVRPQDELKVAIDPNRIHIFDKETEKAVLN